MTRTRTRKPISRGKNTARGRELAKTSPARKKKRGRQVFRDRIRELRMVDASEIKENPKNWRRHPNWQRVSMSAALEEIGIADAVLVYENQAKELILIDGELRKGLLDGQQIPAVILDVTEPEADMLLATLDPLAAMADMEPQTFAQLLDGLEASREDFQDLLKFLHPSPQGDRGPADGGGVVQESDTRVVQLFFSGAERQTFDAHLKLLQGKFKIKDPTAIVLECLRYADKKSDHSPAKNPSRKAKAKS